MNSNSSRKWNKIKRDKLGDLPEEPSSNLQSPEIAPSGITKTTKKKKSSISEPRTRLLGLRISEKSFKKLKMLAVEEDRFLNDIVEIALKQYTEKKLTDQQLLEELQERIEEGRISYRKGELSDGKKVIKLESLKVKK